MIKATRERDATRKAEQAKAAAVVATAAETTATLHNSDMPLAADIHLWPAEGSDAVVVQDSSTVESGSLAHRCAVAQPQCQTDAAGQQLMNAPDTEMLLNTSDQFLQQPQSDTCFPGHAQKAAQSNEDAQKAAQAHAHGARSHHTCNGQAVNDAARHSALAGSKPTADCLANSRDGSLQLKRNLQLGNSSISRALPTQHEQSAEDQRSHHVDLTLSDEPDRLSGEMLEFDIDDEHDAVQKPDAQHGRALQHLQLPNARPAFVSSSAHQKLSADPRTDVNHKSVASSVLHSFQFGQSTADALSELDAVVADSNSD